MAAAPPAEAFTLLREVISAPRSIRLRRGVLRFVSGAQLQTPALLLPCTTAGAPAFLNPHVSSVLQTRGHETALHVPLQKIISRPGARVLQKFADETKASSGLRAFLQLPMPVLLSLRDTLDTTPTVFTKGKITINSKRGRTIVRPEDYIALAEAVRPDAVIAMADEVDFATTANRARKAVDSTVKATKDTSGALATLPSAPLVFGSIQGGAVTSSRVICCQKLSAMASTTLTGFNVGGIGFEGETMEQRASVLSTVTECLPADRPRLLLAPATEATELVDAALRGIDVLDGSLAAKMTESNLAFDLPLSDVASWSRDAFRRLLKVTDASLAEDLRPLAEGCACFTCQNHTRAYLFHLRETGEMLADSLLQEHNVFQLLEVMAMLRAAAGEDEGILRSAWSALAS